MRFDEDKHIAYEGQEFRIEWYVDAKGESLALDYANEMPESHIGKFMHLLEVMGDIGRIYDKTKFRNEGDKIYAFKPQPYRFLCFFTIGRRIIITNGFYKDQDKLPQAEKNLALKIMDDYIKSVKEGDYYD
jgi:phage-related protein